MVPGFSALPRALGNQPTHTQIEVTGAGGAQPQSGRLGAQLSPRPALELSTQVPPAAWKLALPRRHRNGTSLGLALTHSSVTELPSQRPHPLRSLIGQHTSVLLGGGGGQSLGGQGHFQSSSLPTSPCPLLCPCPKALDLLLLPAAPHLSNIKVQTALYS